MSVRKFIQKDNVTMLWEVISDEENFKFLTRDMQANVYQLFLNNIQGFFDNEKIKTNSLVDMNKKYILLILNHIKRNLNIQPNKITIYQEPIKESITYEEIQNDRRSKFERDFNKKQEEFEDIMTIKAPPVPEFADKESDRPIKEMDKILKEMQAQRNYEIEQINRNQSTTTQVDNWLTPQETSLKTEKFTPVEQTQNYSRFKFLNQETQEIVKDKKNVSFSNIEEIQTFNIEDEEDDNIFAKLKKVSNKQTENIKLKMHEPILSENKEDRIAKLEREVKNMNNKMDKILELLSKN
jgi:hypothetical protein